MVEDIYRLLAGGQIQETDVAHVGIYSAQLPVDSSARETSVAEKWELKTDGLVQMA